MLIFELSQPGRTAAAQLPADVSVPDDLPQQFRRESDLGLPQVSELGVVRHYTRLSQKNFSIDTQFYPLGSCTMKYNPRACNSLAMLDGFLARHPYAPERLSQGFMACMHDLQEILAGVTGMKGGVSLAPMAGAQGELAGVAMIMAYHRDRGDDERNEIIVPDAAHGTNPATATMCGCKVREIPTQDDGDIDVDALKKVLGPKTAGIMLTNPSTIGVFERRIKEIAALVHEAGGLLYYDGANLNAILGKVRPGDMGFDAIHMNLHKTFSTPHGGGGPGAGAVGVSERLRPYLPIPMIEKVNRAEGDAMAASGTLPPSGLRPPSPASGVREKHGQSKATPLHSQTGEDAHGKSEAKSPPPRAEEDAHGQPGATPLPPRAGEDAHGQPGATPLPPRAGEDARRAEGGTSRNPAPWYQWVRKKDRPQSIGRLTSFAGNAGVLLRAYVYARMLGREGMVRVAEHATLNANYLAKCMQNAGFTLAYPQRRASHEFIVTVAPQKKASGITAMDFSKGLIDRDIHAPTNYFPLLVPEAMLIEPTETETKQTLDRFVEVMGELLTLSRDDPQALKDAPRNLPVRRLDEVKAARELDVIWQPPQQAA